MKQSSSKSYARTKVSRTVKSPTKPAHSPIGKKPAGKSVKTGVEGFGSITNSKGKKLMPLTGKLSK